MSLKIFSSLVLIFFIGCSTTPIRYDRPIKANDYKNYYQLKEQKAHPVSKKSIGQKVKEIFTKKPKAKTVPVQQAKTNKVEIKKSRSLIPTRRIRKTNTAPITNTTPVLLANTRPGDAEVPHDIGKTIMLYLIYLQALIIAIFAYAILKHRKKVKKPTRKTGELNL